MAEEERKQDRIRFHYIKSNFFRVIHVDGMYGGPTPRGGIHIALYSERVALPQVQEFKIDPSGGLGIEISESRVGKEGVVREIEADATMDLEVARSLHSWLGTVIGIVEANQPASVQLQHPAEEPKP